MPIALTNSLVQHSRSRVSSSYFFLFRLSGREENKAVLCFFFVCLNTRPAVRGVLTIIFSNLSVHSTNAVGSEQARMRKQKKYISPILRWTIFYSCTITAYLVELFPFFSFVKAFLSSCLVPDGVDYPR